MSLDMLPASFGYCLLLTYRTPSRPWCLLVDAGPDETYGALNVGGCEPAYKSGCETAF